MTKWADQIVRVPPVEKTADRARCNECGFDIGRLGVKDLTIVLQAIVGEWRQLFDPPRSAAAVRACGNSSEWSPLQRAAQVRDVLHAKTNRIERLRDSGNPSVDEAGLDAPRPADNDLEPSVVLAAMAANAERLKMVVWTMPRQRWSYEGRRHGMSVQAEALFHEALHCAAHGLHDAKRVVGA